MKKRQWRMMVCLGTLLALGCLYAAWEMHPSGTATLPGTGERQRTILRVWDVDGPTGSSAWLRAQCGKFEKIMPGLTVYLRSVPSSECFAPETVLPDVICFADGTFSTPEQVLAPLHGVESVSETFLQSGRWQGEQYALPLAAEPWVLAVGDAYLPAPAQTPVPTTLLGRAAATPQPDDSAAMPPPGYPAQAKHASGCAWAGAVCAQRMAWRAATAAARADHDAGRNFHGIDPGRSGLSAADHRPMGIPGERHGTGTKRGLPGLGAPGSPGSTDALCGVDSPSAAGSGSPAQLFDFHACPAGTCPTAFVFRMRGCAAVLLVTLGGYRAHCAAVRSPGERFLAQGAGGERRPRSIPGNRGAEHSTDRTPLRQVYPCKNAVPVPLFPPSSLTESRLAEYNSIDGFYIFSGASARGKHRSDPKSEGGGRRGCP